ncbi:MAG: Holliday junction branch migration protein RuvA [Gammaproteobacteria bacterium]|nr:Holliday junction branch migration protein RuvA [Gammaproteobacteria bacterium]NCF83179.1 Holliday junction branch migration protein RuvA [Pseudomonadota bacterium]
MIAWLKGVLREKQPPWLLIDVGGIGYELQASMTTFSALPSTGTDVALFAHQVVREDAHQLFGFAERSERDVFRQLLKVNGVGAKVALAILSGMDAATLGRCVLEGDTTRLTRLPGIGKKTAERLVIEMRDRLGNLPGGGELGSPLGGASGNGATDPASEAVSALIALGLKGPEASRRVSAIDCGSLASEDIVRLALKAMVK